MKKRIRVLGAALLVSSLFVNTMFTDSLMAAPSEVDQIKDEIEDVQQNVNAMEDELADTLSLLYDTETKMAELGDAISQANEELVVAQENEEKQYESMKLRIKTMYENGDTIMLTKIFESGSISEMLKNVENVQTLHEYDRAELQEFIENKERIKTLKAQLEEDMKIQEGYRKDYEKQEQRLNAAIDAEKAKAEDLDTKLKDAIKKAEEEARRQAAIREARRKAEEARRREEERRRQEEERRRQEAEQNQNNTQENTQNTEPEVDAGGKGDTALAQKIVNAAYSYMGVPYSWGGTSKSGIDCSGLTMMCHQAAGISIPRVSYSQAGSGKNVGGIANAKPGDVVCFPGHVGIYIGNGQMIHAPQTGDVVKVSSVFRNKPITAVRRYW